DSERGDAPGHQPLQITELRRTSCDADPQDAWRATWRKHAHTIQDDLERRAIDVAAERVDNGWHLSIVHASQEDQRQMRVLGLDPLERRRCAKRRRHPLLLNS